MTTINNKKDKNTKEQINNYHNRLSTYNTSSYLFSITK